MTTTKRLLVCALLALCSLMAVGVGSASACSQTTPLTFYNGYVDAYDQPKNIFYVFWGYGTYGDPVSFQSAANAQWGSNGLLDSFGIDSRKFYGVPSEYAGYDWSSGAYEQIAPTQGANWITDEGGLPAPNGAGQIILDDGKIADEADFVGNYFGLSYDDVVVVFTPQNAPQWDSGLCGRHFTAPGDTITAWVSYPGVGGCSFDNQLLAAQHEITEAVTDPAYDHGPTFEGWDQGTGAICEISDICQSKSFLVQVQPSSAATTTQTELSNAAIAAGQNGCVYGRGTDAFITGLSGGNLFVQTVQANTSVTINSAVSWGHPTGVTLTGAPGAASWGKTSLDVFVRATNNKIYHANSIDGGGPLWELLNSSTNFTQSPDAVSWGAGNIQVFGVQGNNIVRNNLDYPGGWSGWTSVNKPSGVNPVSKVSVAAWGASNVSLVFPTSTQTIVAAFRGSDGKVWIGNSVSGGSFTWSGFTAPATLTGDLDISAWAPPRLDLFVLDTSGNLWDMVSTNGTTVSKSVKFGHPTAGGFQLGGSVASLGDGRLLLGGRTGTNAPYVQFWNWQPGTWAATGFAFTSPIDIAAP